MGNVCALGGVMTLVEAMPCHLRAQLDMGLCVDIVVLFSLGCQYLVSTRL